MQELLNWWTSRAFIFARLQPPEGFFNDRRSALSDVQHRDFVTTKPLGADRIVGSGQRTTRYAADVIEQDVMKLRLSRCIACDSLEDLDETENLHLEPGFFLHFAPKRAFQALARFDSATRQ